jgi:hypothetical protein
VNGGAIATVNPSTNPTLLNNVTLRADTAGTSGSELYVSGASPTSVYTISNSLVSGSCAGVAASAVSHASIESPGNTCGFDAAKNSVSIADASLRLSVLANNGGPTRTISPLTGSPLINAGGNDCEKVDQRDFSRNIGQCDVGALEVGATDIIFADGFQ